MATKHSYYIATRADKTSTFKGGIAVQGNLNFGDASTDTLTVTGALTATTDVTFTLGATEAFTLTCTDISAPLVMTNTITTPGKTGARALFHVETNVALGGWSNALKGIVVYGAAGRTTGLGSAVCAEMTMSAGTTSGTYAPLEIELNMGASGVTGTNTSLMYMSVNDAASTTFDTNGYLFNLQGVASGSGSVFLVGAPTTLAASLRVMIGATPYYMALYSGQS